jgi:hypothetical protein
MTTEPQDHPTTPPQDSTLRQATFSCLTFIVVASFVLSLLAITAAVLVSTGALF